MNPLIEDLDRRAREYGISVRDTSYETFHAKFAELIVQECLSKISEWDMGADHPVGADDLTSQVARDMLAEIKQHFGLNT